MHGRNGELAMREGAGLVEDNGIDLRQDIHIVGTLDENTFPRGTPDATEERQRHTDDEGTGTGDHEEHQGTVQPRGEVGSEK